MDASKWVLAFEIYLQNYSSAFPKVVDIDA
jgi:hypothetical protein